MPKFNKGDRIQRQNEVNGELFDGDTGTIESVDVDPQQIILSVTYTVKWDRDGKSEAHVREQQLTHA